VVSLDGPWHARLDKKTKAGIDGIENNYANYSHIHLYKYFNAI